jgi:redox-sensing transcriptional repressor
MYYRSFEYRLKENTLAEIRKQKVPEHTLRRIPRYHQILIDLEGKGEIYVSSQFLSSFFNIDDTQVRKDLAIIGYHGKPKTGYSVNGLREAIGNFLGINYENKAVLIGAGKLGSALIEYPGFHDYGLKIVGIFDNDPGKIGTIIGDLSILAMESLPRVVRSYEIGIAIVTVPKQTAQQVVDNLVSLGIKGIWNFAPAQLQVPDDVVLRNENIAVGLAILSHYVNKQKAGV